jgi:DNA-binding NarL/FixJ family response regulator
MELRIGLIESNELVRAGRAMVIDSQSDMKVVFEESDPRAALMKSPDYLIDVLVIESNPRGYDLSNFLSKIRENQNAKGSHPAIVVSSTFANSKLHALGLAAGAAEVIDLESGAESFLAALRDCSKADYLASIEVLKQAGELLGPSKSKDLEEVMKIAATQPKVIKNFLAGLGDLENAKKLDIAKLRVRQTLDALLKAGGFQTRNQLAIALLGEQK